MKNFSFNEHGVCVNPEWLTYYEHRGNPLSAYCRIALFKHPDTSEWMGCASFKTTERGQHGVCSKWSLRRFATRDEAELHYLDYMLSDQFKGLGSPNWGDYSYLSPEARRAAQARLAFLRPAATGQLSLFSAA